MTAAGSTPTQEQTLLKTGALQRAILNSASFSSIATDEQGVIQIFNVGAERMLGYAAADVLNKITPADISDPQEVIARAEALSAELGTTITPGFDALVFKASRGIEDIYELTYIRKDGSRFPAIVSVTALRDDAGRILGYLLIGTDNTARKRVEAEHHERLEEVERLKQGFLSTVSHELRTPLTSIRGSLGLLASGALGALSAEAVELVSVAERNAVRLSALINDILDLERLENGKIELQFTYVPVDSVLRRAMESLATFGQTQGVTVEAPEVSSMIWGDADRIVQVLVNLLTNAVKFSPPGGVVTIGVGRRESWIEFRVTDHGRGVPAEHRRAIFERFRQVETSDAREKGGTGLGLAICKSIVEQHGGTIGVESEEGVGSTFWFRIATAVRPVESRRGRAILVCDEEAARREYFEEVITQAGYAVLTVPDGDAAWAVLQAGDVAVVVLKDDTALAARIREEPAFASVPVILFGSPLVVSPDALSDRLVLVLPERVDSATLLAAICDAMERGRIAEGRNVLVVEDDLTLLDVMTRQLSRQGIVVRTATTGEEAIRAADAEPPSLIVLDVGLPERDGFDVVDAMRRRPALRGIPVLVYTGRDLTEEQRGRLRLGPTRFLTKSKVSDAEFLRLVIELRQVPSSAQ